MSGASETTVRSAVDGSTAGPHAFNEAFQEESEISVNLVALFQVT